MEGRKEEKRNGGGTDEGRKRWVGASNKTERGKGRWREEGGRDRCR